ncbi:hypothetical protein [Streptacidiphilus neutrinimicus]|uniref:hypothetical protein n=1 Tax=Streptacidiphilus neutrinimicus TaxID=105420 RepID=UPI0005AB7312|nr:hypothetical protein [Streptacidiphilus neutrinimicus]
MKPSRRALAAATAVLLGLAPLTLATASPASAETALPIAHFSHLVVDQTHGHLFISGGSGTTSILVTDFQGATVSSIPVPSGATGLALSPDGATVYAALPDSDTITAIDTTTLTQKATYPTGTGTRPDSLATSDGRIWFGYGPEGHGNIGSLAADGTVALDRDTQDWPYAPTLATTNGAPGLLVAGTEDWNTGTAPFSVYTADATGLTRTAHTSLGVSDLSDFALTPDGKDIAVGSFATVNGGRYRTSDLTADSNYFAGLPGTMLSIAGDGTVAVTNNIRNIRVTAADGSGIYNGYFTGPDRRVAPHGLAWASDESRLFAVTTDDSGDSPALQIQTQPEVASTNLGYFPTGTYAPGEPITLMIADNGGVPFHPGDALTVTRFDADHPQGVALPSLSMAPGNGWPTLHDTAPTHGPLSYRFDYAGGPHHAPATLSVTVPLAAYAPTLTLHAPAAAARGAALAVTGRLTWPHAHVDTGSLHVTRTDLAHPHGYGIGTVPVGADGTFTVHDAPGIGGTNTYSFTYDGGTTYLPVTESATVQVTRANTTVTVRTDKSVYNYDGWAKVTAHLGTTYNGRTLTLTAYPAGGTPTTLKTGTVDANGNLTAWYKLTRNTTFSAAFTGDYRYNPTNGTTTAYTHAVVTDTLLQHVGTTRINGTVYQLYMRDTTLQPLLQTTVAPDHSGQGLAVLLQRYAAGSWHTVSTDNSYRLKSHSGVDIPLPWAHLADYTLYRVIVEYTHDSTDTGNIDTWGNWQYFTVRPHP